MKNYNEIHDNILKLKDGNYINNVHARLEAVALYIVECSIDGQDITYCSTLENVEHIRYFIRLYFRMSKIIKVNAPTLISLDASFESTQNVGSIHTSGGTFYELDNEFKYQNKKSNSTISLSTTGNNGMMIQPYTIIDFDDSITFEPSRQHALNETWTDEMVGGLKHCYGFDVEKELEDILKQEILNESMKY